MTAPSSLSASEQFQIALDHIRHHKLDTQERRPLLNLSATPPRRGIKGEGAVGGVRGDMWDTAARLRLGSLSVDDVVARAKQRISDHAERLNAFEYVANVDANAASMAREAASGAWRGPLHGLPISVKDIIDVQGMPTTGSSRALPPRIAEFDARAVDRLRTAGALIMGKSVTHEFALGVTTPQSHSPWDESRIPGGSSGGSVISVVTGMALGSLGTDTRASIRVPSALSSAVGFRPTTGVVPVDRWLCLSWSMDVFAPMARSVRDVALMMDMLTASGQVYRDALPGSLAGLRVAYSDAFLTGSEPSVRDAFDNALQAATHAGAHVWQRSNPTSDDLALCNTAGMIVSRAEAAQAHLEAGTDLALCTDEVGGQLGEAREVLATDYLRCLRIRDELYDRFMAMFDDTDLLIMPTSKVVAPPRSEADRYLMALSENCIAWSLLGMPAISLYMGSANGLPMGVQLVAPPGQDEFLLACAHALEAELPMMPEWQP
jgi:aspartyl-tRNA(Asn)/glutamyl-tRNA(Gln) amidotransferase subunit A